MEDKNRKSIVLRRRLSVEDIYTPESDTDNEATMPQINSTNLTNSNNLNNNLNTALLKEDVTGDYKKTKLSTTINKELRNNDYFTKNQENELNHTLKADHPFRLDRIKVLLLLEVLMIVDIMLEGNEKFPSLIGIRK